jgi:hypothetical protein
MIVLRFGMQGEDIVEHTIGKCHVYVLVCKRKLFLNILMSRVICI